MKQGNFFSQTFRGTRNSTEIQMCLTESRTELGQRDSHSLSGMDATAFHSLQSAFRRGIDLYRHMICSSAAHTTSGVPLERHLPHTRKFLPSALRPSLPPYQLVLTGAMLHPYAEKLNPSAPAHTKFSGSSSFYSSRSKFLWGVSPR